MVEYKNFTNECGIYCFKNLINNKCYIGQAVNLKKRLRAHYSAIKTGRNLQLALYKAINKYGIDNFDLSIIEYVNPSLENIKSILDDLEKKYIQQYNSYAPNGYNMTEGGDAGVLGLKMTEEQKQKISKSSQKQNEKYKKRIWARKIEEQKYCFGLTYEEASKKSGIYKGIISQICNKNYNHPYAKGWTFAFDELTLFRNCAQALRDKANGIYTENGGKFTKDINTTFRIRKPLLEYNDEGEIVCEYSSISEASKTLKISQSSLHRYLKQNRQLKIRGHILKLKV